MLVLRMPRRIVLWLPCLTLVALSACGGSENGFFSDDTGGTGGFSRAGAPSSAGSSSGGPSSAGSIGAGTAGQDAAGNGSGGAQSAGAAPGGSTSSGGASLGGATNAGGAAGRTSGAGSGGSAASAGQAGGKGGSANGGSAGSAGSNQDPSCSELTKRASQQLEAARVCNLDQEALQCTGKVTTQCGCQVPVQRTESAETKAYLKTLKEIEDKHCIIACTAIACMAASNAQCKASGSSAMGTCVATSHGPTF